MVSHPPHPGVSVLNPNPLISGSSVQNSNPSLINQVVDSSQLNVGSQMGSISSSQNLSNVGNPKSSVTTENLSNVGSQMGAVTSENLSNGPVCSASNYYPPNSNYPGAFPNSAQNYDPNSGQIAGSDSQITSPDLVASGDAEMVDASDPSLDSAEFSPVEIRSLRKLLSPANVRKIPLGRLPGDAGIRPKTKKRK